MQVASKQLLVHFVVLFIVALSSLLIPAFLTLSALMGVTFWMHRRQADYTIILASLYSAPFHLIFGTVTWAFMMVFALIMVVFILYHTFIVRRVKYIGSLGIAFLFLVDALVLRLLNAETIFEGLEGILVIALVFIVYMISVNAFRPRKYLLNDLSRVAMFLLTLASVFLLIVTFSDHSAGNFLAYVIVVTLPISGYLLAVSHRNVVLMPIIIVPVMILALSGSSPSALTALFLSVASIIYVLYSHRMKKGVMRQSLVMLLITLFTLSLITLLNPAQQALSHFISTTISQTEDVLQFIATSTETFLNAPLFGTIWHKRIDFSSIVVQLLSLGGIVALVFIYLQYRKIKLLLKTDQRMRYFLIVLFIGVIAIHGLFAPLYFHPVFLLTLLTTIAAMEVNVKSVRSKL